MRMQKLLTIDWTFCAYFRQEKTSAQFQYDRNDLCVTSQAIEVEGDAILAAIADLQLKHLAGPQRERRPRQGGWRIIIDPCSKGICPKQTYKELSFDKHSQNLQQQFSEIA